MGVALQDPSSTTLTTLSTSARERSVALLCSLVVVTTYVAIAGLDGALGVPRNDDWEYYRTAFDVLHLGWFAPDPFTRTMLVGQILLAQPVLALFGNSILALQLGGAVLAAVGLWATYLVIRQGLNITWSAFSVSCLALGPIYGSLAPTFMSDVPSFALQALALLAGVTALTAQRRPLAWLSLSLAVALAAFSIREYSVAVPLAVVVGFLTSRGLLRTRHLPGPNAARARRERVGTVALGLGWLVCAATLYFWRVHLTGTDSGVHLRWTAPAHDAVRVLFTGSLLLVPAVLLLWRWPRKAWAWHQWVALAAALALIVPRALERGDTILTGNYLTQSGSYPETLHGSRPAIIAHPVWVAVLVLAIAAAVTIVAMILDGILAWAVRRTRQRRDVGAPPEPADVEGNADTGAKAAAYGLLVREPALVLWVVYSLTTLASVLAVSVPVPWVGDRYLFPVVPYLAAALVWLARRSTPSGLPRSSRALGAIGLVALAALGTFQVDAAATLDGAKWRMGEALTRAGRDPATVDAGLEWFGFHQRGKVQTLKQIRGQDFWVGLFNDPRVCVQVTRADPAAPASYSASALASLTAEGLVGSRFVLIAREAHLRC